MSELSPPDSTAPAPADAASSTAWVVSTTPATFLDDVVTRSQRVPVVVDFWAEWCGPCRVLGPTLERLADEFAGAFVLVKADTGQVGDIAAGFGVRSIPAVFGLRDGKVVDSFVGALPESAIRSWLTRFLPSRAEGLATEARALEASEPDRAQTLYREAAELDSNLVAAQAGLARLAVAAGRLDEAQGIVDALARRGFLEPEVEAIRADLTVRSRAASGVDVGDLRQKLAANPNDFATQLALAEALAAAGETTEALDLALDLVERDRRGTGEPARKLMIAVFQLLPPDDEVAIDRRRKLSFAL